MINSPTGFFVSDIETDPFKWQRRVKAFAAGASDGVTCRTWWGRDCIAQVLLWLRNRRGICYFHNGGKFDFHHLLPHMTMRDLDPCPVMINNRIVSLKWRQIEFRDSYAIVPKPLRSWAKDDIEIRKLEEDRRERHKDEILSYLRGDHRYLHEMLSEMRDRYCPGGRLPLTLASLTFKIMERDFGIKVIHTSRSFDRRFRPFYFGGRVEFWKLGRCVGDFRILDINSAFPRAMMDRHFWSEEFTKTKPRKNHVPDPQSFYRIRCEQANGAFPKRSKDGIRFTVDGGGDFCVSGWELLAGVRHAKGVEILNRFAPAKTISFKAYVRHFYHQKQHAKDKAERYFSKLILNAFYGKLAQNDENFRETLIRPYRKWPHGKGWVPVADDKASGRSIFQRKGRSFSKPYCVATGASITGWVRAELFRVIRANPGVLYCDTDSLITPAPVRSCPVGEGLGEWKEEMRCDVVWIAGKKLYAAHNAAAPWLRDKPARTGWIHVERLGWTPGSREAWLARNPRLPEDVVPWKTAAKGVRLPVLDIIAVAEGHARTYRQEAPVYGLGREPTFMIRRVVRADMGVPGQGNQPIKKEHVA